MEISDVTSTGMSVDNRQYFDIKVYKNIIDFRIIEIILAEEAGAKDSRAGTRLPVLKTAGQQIVQEAKKQKGKKCSLNYSWPAWQVN